MFGTSMVIMEKLILCLFWLNCVNLKDAYIKTTGSSVTRFVGDNVRLTCGVNSGGSVRWQHIPKGNKNRIDVSNNNQLSAEYASLARFFLDIDSISKKYDLLIKNASGMDSGSYICNSGESESSVELIVEKNKNNLLVRPVNTTVMQGKDVRLNCSTSYSNPVYWQHRPVGASQKLDVSNGVMTRRYAATGRYELEVEASIGQYDLKIQKSQICDAGSYLCIDDEGFGQDAVAELVVIASPSVCTNNITDDGVTAENKCGLERETVKITCLTTYFGNRAPQLILRHGDSTFHPETQETIEKSNTTIVSTFLVQPSLQMMELPISCEFTGLSMTPKEIVCALPNIKIRDLPRSTKILREKTGSSYERISLTCLVDGPSQNCSYAWMNTVHPDEIVSQSQTLVLSYNSLGDEEFLCAVQCTLDGATCRVNSDPLAIIWGNDSSFRRMRVLYASALAIFICGHISFVFILHRKKIKHWVRKCLKSGYTIPLSTESEAMLSDFQEKPIRTIASQNEVRGLALLSNTIYILRWNMPVIETYNCVNFKSIPSIPVPSLKDVNARDMIACPVNSCLYISEADTGKSIHKIRVDQEKSDNPHGNDILSWHLKYNPEGLSTTPSGDVIITYTSARKLDIYNSNGGFIESINLDNVIQSPWHAIQRESGDILISSGISHTANIKSQYGVYLIDRKEGKMLINGEKTVKIDNKSKDLVRMTTTGEGRVLVADYEGKRILFLDRLLGKVISTLDVHAHASRLCIDESNKRLWVAVDNNKFEVKIYEWNTDRTDGPS